MPRKQPLYLRLYSQPHLMALVRLVGYQELTMAEAKERVKPLGEEFGVERMKAAAQELLQLDATHDPPTVRLSDAVRRLAWQLLGPPPADDACRVSNAPDLPPCA